MRRDLSEREQRARNPHWLRPALAKNRLHGGDQDAANRNLNLARLSSGDAPTLICRQDSAHRLEDVVAQVIRHQRIRIAAQQTTTIINTDITKDRPGFRNHSDNSIDMIVQPSGRVPQTDPPPRLQCVQHPDIWLDICTLIGLQVHHHGRQCARHDMRPALGEAHLRPAFPLCDGAGDAHGLGRDAHHLRADAPVYAQPGIEGCAAVVMRPCNIVDHRYQRIAVLHIRADGRDQIREALGVQG